MYMPPIIRMTFLFFIQKTDLHLAVGSEAQCEGIGAAITRLTPNIPPILLTPVYYCQSAKISTLSPSALKHYNRYYDVTI